MFSNYQWLLTLVVIACIGYLVVYGSSSTSIKEGLQGNCPAGQTWQAGSPTKQQDQWGQVEVSALPCWTGANPSQDGWVIEGTGEQSTIKKDGMCLQTALGATFQEGEYNAPGAVMAPCDGSAAQNATLAPDANQSYAPGVSRIIIRGLDGEAKGSGVACPSSVPNSGTAYKCGAGGCVTLTAATDNRPHGAVVGGFHWSGGGTSGSVVDGLDEGGRYNCEWGAPTNSEDNISGEFSKWVGTIQGIKEPVTRIRGGGPAGPAADASPRAPWRGGGGGWGGLCLSANTAGYSPGKCIPNNCTCPNGTPATTTCTTNNAVKCASCKAGYTLNTSNNTCVANTCTCPNGTPATTTCTTNNAVKCASCPAGYTLNTSNNTCVANTCTCPNGTPATTTCTTNNAVKCASCKAGYTLNTSNNTCVANTCTCPNGTPATTTCTTNNAVKCASCKAGYTLNTSNNTCVANTCTCPNGTPATTTCTTNNAVKCAKCATGFHAVGDSCVANPQCSSYTCPPGRQYKSNYAQIGCQTATCQDRECCDPIPQPTCTSFTCPKNSTLNQKPSSITCAGKSCTDRDCCTPNPKPTCFGDNMKCPTNFYLKSNGQQIQCANYTCATDECCSANPTCSTIQCGPKFHPKPSSTICASSTCVSTECCTPNPVCLTYTCPAGMKQKSNASSITCTGATCAAPECCSVIPPPPPPPPPGVPPPPPPPSSNITDDPTNIYFPNSNFISFNNEAYEEHSSPSDPNEDSYSPSYSNYNGWTSPKESSLSRTNNMFAATNLPPPIGIASFNNRSYNQA